MSMKARLNRLEKKTVSTVKYPVCPTCGWSDGATAVFTTSFRERGEPDEPQPSDFCATCNHQWVFRIRFDRCG